MSIKNSKKDILNRIKEYYNIKSNIDLAKFLEVAPTTISTWIARDSIDYDKIFSICEELDLNWLVRGEYYDGQVNRDKALTNLEDGQSVYHIKRKKGEAQTHSGGYVFDEMFSSLFEKLDNINAIQNETQKVLNEKNEEWTVLKSKLDSLEKELDGIKQKKPKQNK